MHYSFQQNLAIFLIISQTERAETDPAQVKKVEAGTLDYKVPVVYSNIHSDEIIGADGCLDFVEAVVEAAEGDGKIPYNKITGLTSTGKATLQAEMSRTVRSGQN